MKNRIRPTLINSPFNRTPSSRPHSPAQWTCVQTSVPWRLPYVASTKERIAETTNDFKFQWRLYSTASTRSLLQQCVQRVFKSDRLARGKEIKAQDENKNTNLLPLSSGIILITLNNQTRFDFPGICFLDDVTCQLALFRCTSPQHFNINIWHHNIKIVDQLPYHNDMASITNLKQIHFWKICMVDVATPTHGTTKLVLNSCVQFII